MPELMQDTQSMFGGMAAPEGRDLLDPVRLQAWMDTHVQGFRGPLRQGKFAGGQSNPTYRLDSPSGSYVLRRKPFGTLLPSAHAVDREFKVIAGLHGIGFAVARPYGLCTDDDVIGSWFYVMQMVEGRTIWNGSIPEARDRGERHAIYLAMVDTLAELHSVDVAEAGLTDFGKTGNYFARQVDRWTRQYRLSETEGVPAMERLIEYLPATIPEQTTTTVVHGDYRIDNIIFERGSARVLAVLDWELSTLGDPLSDFTYFAMAWMMENAGRAGLLDVDRAALGIPELDEIVERYCSATGRDGIPDLNWHLAYNLFRMTAIGQGIRKRMIDGTASSAHAQAVAAKVPATADLGWHYAVMAGAA